MYSHLSFNSYSSSRRRLSQPEKPQPRFQWRMRVNSLMMDDDTDNTPSLEERRDQRYDYRRGSREKSSGLLYNPDDVLTQPTNASATDRTESHRTRRERLERTKSEGHLKFRLRLSRFSEAYRSLDDDGESKADSEPECTRKGFRASREVEEGDTKDQDSESPSKASKSQPIAQGEVKDFTSDQKSQGACYEPEQDFRSSEASLESKSPEKDVSRGAIPKHYPDARGLEEFAMSDKSEQLQSNEASGGATAALTNHGVNKIFHDRSEEEDTTTSSKLPSTTANGNSTNKYQPGSSSETNELRQDSSSHSKEANSSQDLLWSKLQDKASGPSNKEFRVERQADDIESIIEQIIAEEEAMVSGKKTDRKEIKTSIQHMSEEDISSLKDEMQSMQEKINDCNEESAAGIDIQRRLQPEKSLSSSLPSYYSGEKSILPYSSSCPLAQNQAKDDSDEDEEDEEYGYTWADMPVILLEDVFTLLTPKERHQASMVCRQWYDLFYSPRVWETFILLERTLTKKRFNLYKGYQRELCPGKTQLCFRRVGSFFKRIVVTPITDYFNLYEFLRILAAFLQFQEDHGQTAMPLLHTFDFTFACASRGDGGEMVHGTGGQILAMIQQLLLRMSNLKHLKLNQLLIDVMELPGLFEAIANCFRESLNTLEMLNVTKVPLPLTDLAQFRNLIKLTISPQHINEEVLLLLAGLNILQLKLLQDPYTCECQPVSYEAWKLFHEMAPWLHVYLEVSGLTKAQLLIQPRAPVHGVFLRTPYSRLTNDLVMSLVEHYSKTLRYFVQERLPRVHGPRGFHSRCDSSLLFLVRRCSALQTLVVRERISTSTLILLANEGRNLSTLLVRQNALIKRCDWPQTGEWSKDFYSRLKKASLDYHKCIDEICTLLRRRWRPLTDKQFIRLNIVPRLEMI